MSDYSGYIWCNADAVVLSVKEDMWVTYKLRPLTTMKMVRPERSEIVIIVLEIFTQFAKRNFKEYWHIFVFEDFVQKVSFSCLNMTKLEIVPKFQVFNLHLRRTELKYFLREVIVVIVIDVHGTFVETASYWEGFTVKQSIILLYEKLLKLWC